MIESEKIKKLKRAIDSKEKEYVASKAIHDRLLKELEEKFGVKSVAEAQKKLKKLKADFKKAESKLEEQYDDFVAKHGEKLGLC